MPIVRRDVIDTCLFHVAGDEEIRERRVVVLPFDEPTTRLLEGRLGNVLEAEQIAILDRSEE